MLTACQPGVDNSSGKRSEPQIRSVSTREEVSLIVLGNVQDAGSPQIGCMKSCCIHLHDTPDPGRKVTSIGLVDPSNGRTFLFEATPDIGAQMKMLTDCLPGSPKVLADGIFLTHAHIGHYAGLMFLGKEAIDAQQIPLYAMPRMRKFISENGPWSQLVSRQNVLLRAVKDTTVLSPEIRVESFLVPHRDEFSETVGYKIYGPNKSALFIPDIDKWSRWDRDIVEEVNKVDYAFLDATFYSGEEMNNRDISQIPHPFVIESLEKFEALGKEERGKIIFIHLNHTNPLLNPNSEESKYVLGLGYQIARMGDTFAL